MPRMPGGQCPSESGMPYLSTGKASAINSDRPTQSGWGWFTRFQGKKTIQLKFTTSVGGSGEGPSKVFAHPNPPVRYHDPRSRYSKRIQCCVCFIITDADVVQGTVSFPRGHRTHPPPTSIAGYAGPSRFLTDNSRMSGTTIRGSKRGQHLLVLLGGSAETPEPSTSSTTPK